MGDKSNTDTFYEDGYINIQYLDSFVGEDNDDNDSNQYYDEERSEVLSDEDDVIEFAKAPSEKIVLTNKQSSKGGHKKALAMDFFQFKLITDLLLVKKRQRYPGLMDKKQNDDAAAVDLEELAKIYK